MLAGYFKVPATANYTFIMSSRREAYLYFNAEINATVQDDSDNAQLIAVSTTCRWRTLFSDQAQSVFPDPLQRRMQNSEPIELTHNNYHYYEAGQRRGGKQEDYFTLGVIINPPIYSEIETKAYDIQLLRFVTQKETWTFTITDTCCESFEIEFEIIGAPNINRTTASISLDEVDYAIAHKIKQTIGSHVTMIVACDDTLGNSVSSPTVGDWVACTFTFGIWKSEIKLQDVRALSINLTASAITPAGSKSRDHGGYLGAGSFATLSLNGQNFDIGYNEAERDFEEQLAQIPGIKNPVQVVEQRHISNKYGSYWSIHFKGNPGEDISAITVISFTNPSAIGSPADDPMVEIIEIMDGSTQHDVLFPIPYDMLFTAREYFFRVKLLTLDIRF